jgi:hypothetical protein
MAIVSSAPKDFKALYTGFDSKEVGLGTIEPNIYATPSYQKKKVGKILIGGLQSIIYAGMEHDLNPLVLALAYEPKYNTILGYNLHYITEAHRKAIVTLVMKSNIARIKGQLPLIIDYKMLKKAIPDSVAIIRRYKTVGIKVIESYPLVEWTSVVKQKSKWANWYKDYKK